MKIWQARPQLVFTFDNRFSSTGCAVEQSDRYIIFRLQESYLSATSHTSRKSCRVKSLYMKRFCPEPIVIKPFYPKEGAWEGTEKWEGVQQLLNQLAAFALVINIFPPSPLFVHRVHTKPPVFREGDSNSLFCVHTSTFSLEQRLIAPVKLSRVSSSFL
jgi:hypothetical protein